MQINEYINLKNCNLTAFQRKKTNGFSCKTNVFSWPAGIQLTKIEYKLRVSKPTNVRYCNYLGHVVAYLSRSLDILSRLLAQSLSSFFLPQHRVFFVGLIQQQHERSESLFFFSSCTVLTVSCSLSTSFFPQQNQPLFVFSSLFPSSRFLSFFRQQSHFLR